MQKMNYDFHDEKLSSAQHLCCFFRHSLPVCKCRGFVFLKLFVVSPDVATVSVWYSSERLIRVGLSSLQTFFLSR